MKPPNCVVCGAPIDSRPGHAGPAAGLVTFADHVPLPDGMVGHPPGMEWFCAAHFAAAQALAHQTGADALRRLRRWRLFG